MIPPIQLKYWNKLIPYSSPTISQIPPIQLKYWNSIGSVNGLIYYSETDSTDTVEVLKPIRLTISLHLFLIHSTDTVEVLKHEEPMEVGPLACNSTDTVEVLKPALMQACPLQELIPPIQLKYWNLLSSVYICPMSLFHRYSWSIETIFGWKRIR